MVAAEFKLAEPWLLFQLSLKTRRNASKPDNGCLVPRLDPQHWVSFQQASWSRHCKTEPNSAASTLRSTLQGAKYLLELLLADEKDAGLQHISQRCYLSSIMTLYDGIIFYYINIL